MYVEKIKPSNFILILVSNQIIVTINSPRYRILNPDRSKGIKISENQSCRFSLIQLHV